MILDSISEISNLRPRITPSPPMRSILLVTPEFYEIAYAINPFMRDENGNLHSVNKPLAIQQWNTLKDAYQRLGITVHTLLAQSGLPDMVFAANQSFVWLDAKTGARSVLMGKMRSSFRQPEVPHFEKWYRENGYQVFQLGTDCKFEGTGDALLDVSRSIVLGAFGPRTDPEAYDEMSRRFGLSIVRLELVHPDFYHLDTCLSIINETTAVIYKEAFSMEGQRLIQALFPRTIEVSFEEARKGFACNCHSPDGKTVFIQKGMPDLNTKLQKTGLTVVELDTSEFIKAGGSVFCLKMALF